jgi:GNAT superfamily N-acetyltransferase
MVILRTNSSHSDFLELVGHLNNDLRIRDGADLSFYAQFNKLDNIRHVIVVRSEGIAAGCGAIREFDKETMEIKRMFVRPEWRRRGVATAILFELEMWSKELGAVACVLETGQNQPEAISLYHKCGYNVIPNYGQYENVENSVCMRKELK